MVTPAHYAAAHKSFDELYAGLVDDGYQLSVTESARREVPRVTETTDLTFGEVPFDALSAALAAAALPFGGTFVDLGSGLGRGVLAAALPAAPIRRPHRRSASR